MMHGERSSSCEGTGSECGERCTLLATAHYAKCSMHTFSRCFMCAAMSHYDSIAKLNFDFDSLWQRIPVKAISMVHARRPFSICDEQMKESEHFQMSKVKSWKMRSNELLFVRRLGSIRNQTRLLWPSSEAAVVKIRFSRCAPLHSTCAVFKYS